MPLDVNSIIAASGIVVALATLIGTAVIVTVQQRYRRTGTIKGRTGAEDSGDGTREVPTTEVVTYSLEATASGASGRRLGYITGDMMRVTQADVWVNAENTDMEMARVNDFSISGMIRYWGAERDQSGAVKSDLIAEDLRSAVGSDGPVAPGSAFVTSAGELSRSNHVQHIIHVAAVRGEPGAGFRQVSNVGLCVKNALAKLDELVTSGSASTSILFPLLGTGSGGADVYSTVNVLLGAAINYFDATPGTRVKLVYFLAYSDRDVAALTEAMDAIARLIPERTKPSDETTA